MMSKIAYDLSLIRGVAMDVDGVLSPSTIPMSSDGTPMRMVNIKDGYALQLAAKNLRYHLAVITGADTPAVRERYNGLGIWDVYLKAARKLPVLMDWMDRCLLTPGEVAYIGDDIPDIECMKAVGLSVAPSDAAIDVKEIATYISPVQGGYGVARDLLEQIMRAQGQWMSSADSFGW